MQRSLQSIVFKIGILLASIFLGYFIYIAWWKPLPKGPRIAFELMEHFNDSGIKVSMRTIPNMKKEVHVQLEYTIEDYPLPISVSVYHSTQDAKDNFSSVAKSPNLNFATQNGELILFLVNWEQSEMTEKVLNAFKSS